MFPGFGVSPIETLAREAMLQGLVYCDSSALALKWIDGTATALGASSSVELQLQVGSAGDFVIQMPNLVGKQTSIKDNPDLLVSIVEGGSDRQLFNQPVHVLTAFGRWGLNNEPGVWSMPKLLQANSILSITLTDLSGTKWDYVYMTFLGFRVYYQGGTRQQVFHLL